MSLFKSENDSNIHIIQCPSDIDKIAIKQFESFIESWSNVNVKVHILNFQKVVNLDGAFGRTLSAFKSTILKKEQQLVSVKVPLKVLMQIKQMGLEDVFKPHKSVEDVCEVFGIKTQPKPKVDVQFINPFINAILNYFKQTDKITLKMLPLRARKKEKLVETGVAGIINLNSKSFKGAIRLTLTRPVLDEIYKAIEKKTLVESPEDAISFLGKMMLNVCSTAKQDLIKIGFQDIIQAFPSFFEITPETDLILDPKELSIIIQFDTNFGPLFVEIVTLE